ELERGSPRRHERTGADLGRHVARQLEQLLEPRHSLVPERAPVPERLERLGEREPDCGLVRVEGPAQCRTHVVELRCRSVEPDLLLWAAREPPRRPRELDEEPGMTAAHVGGMLEGVESLLRVLANRLEHPPAR